MIDRIVTKHPFLVIFLFALGLAAEVVFLRIGSNEMRIFVVSFLLFVSVFFTLQNKDSDRNASYSRKHVTQKIECIPTHGLAEDTRYQFVSNKENKQSHCDSNNPLYPHRNIIAGDK